MKKCFVFLLLTLFTHTAFTKTVMAQEASPCEALIEQIEDIGELKKVLRCQNRLILSAINNLKQQGLLSGQFGQSPSRSGQQNNTKSFDATQPAVKKSKSNICHAKGSRYYGQTKTFTPFNTIDACLNSGGRLPKRV